MENLKIELKYFSLLLCLFFTATANSQTYHLVWSDEFTGTGAPDPAKWGYELGYIRNSELQFYTNSTNNVRQNAGNLEITVRKEAVNGYNYTSGSIITKGKTDWAYGKIEGRFKMPNGKGLWACFWTLGTNYDEIWWPKCGEIDIFEHINSENLIHSTAHWENAAGAHISSGHDSPAIEVTQWHVYSIEWTPFTIKWFVDGVQHHELNIANGINNTQAFHKPHYVLINFPIGGNWPGAPDAATVLPATLYCDYIKMYEYVPDVPLSVSAISVSPSALTLPLTKTMQLSTSFIPFIASNKSITWQSDHVAIATVNVSGVVTGIGVGKATITATSVSGGKTSSCEVTVIESVGLNFVLNPSFELDKAEVQKPLNWSEWSTSNSNDNAKIVKGKAHSGDYYGLMTGSVKYDVMNFQTIKNLPVGVYTLKAWIRSSGGQSYSVLSIKNFGGNELTASLNQSMSNWTLVSIPNINITSGQCEIDIYNSATAGQWIEYDDVELSLNTTTAINRSFSVQKMSVYPNPVMNNLLNIVHDGSERCEVKIVNMGGQLIYSQELNSSKTIINTSLFKSGMYIIQLCTGKQNYTEKIFVP